MASMSADRINENRKDRQIYLIKTQVYNYYIIIPVEQQNIKITLGIVDKIDNERIKEVPFYGNNAIVIPVLNEQMVGYLKSNQATYDQAVDYFMNLVSNSSGLLKHNRKVVEPVVVLNNNEQFGNFVNYFISRFPNSIQKSDRDLFRKEVPANNMMMNQNNVVSDVPVNIEAYPSYQDESSLEQAKGKTRVKRKDNRGEPGFVSYVLLGVVIAVMSLVFLYMLI